MTLLRSRANYTKATTRPSARAAGREGADLARSKKEEYMRPAVVSGSMQRKGEKGTCPWLILSMCWQQGKRRSTPKKGKGTEAVRQPGKTGKRSHRKNRDAPGARGEEKKRGGLFVPLENTGKKSVGDGLSFTKGRERLSTTVREEGAFISSECLGGRKEFKTRPSCPVKQRFLLFGGRGEGLRARAEGLALGKRLVAVQLCILR